MAGQSDSRGERPRRRRPVPLLRRRRTVAALAALAAWAAVLAGAAWAVARPGADDVTVLGSAPSASPTRSAAALSPTSTGATSGPGAATVGAGAATSAPAPKRTTKRTARTASSAGGLRVGLAYSDRLPWTTAAERAAALDDTVSVHGGWVRIDLPWVHIQPDSSSQWLWERYDPTVRAARALGLRVLFTVAQAPPWAQDASCRGSYACPPGDPAAYARFVGAAAKHYAPTGARAFEIWNEPNFPVFWNTPDATRYGRLLLAAAKAAHAADPGATVIVGGLAATAPGSTVVDQMTFLSGVCATGACAEIDGVGYHPYTFPVKASLRPSWTTAWTRISRDSRSLRSVLRGKGHGALPIWVTEFGAPTGGPGRVSDGSPEDPANPTDHVSERVQASLASDVVATAARDPQIAALFWYQHQDDAGKQPDREGYFGLRRADGSAKPAFGAFAAAVARLR